MIKKKVPKVTAHNFASVGFFVVEKFGYVIHFGHKIFHRKFQVHSSKNDHVIKKNVFP